MKQPTSKAGEMDWSDTDFRFKNSFMPIKANYVGAPEDITEPILDFIHETIHQAIAQERERIAEIIELYFSERAIEDKRLDIRNDILPMIHRQP